MTSGGRIVWRTVCALNYARCGVTATSSSSSPLAMSSTLFTPVASVSRSICGTSSRFSEDNVVEETPTTKKKKLFIPKITLLSDKDEISLVTLEEAQKIAKRRSLKLIKIVDFDTKTERPVYKLMKITDFIQEESKAKTAAKEAKENALKEDKTITVSSKIDEHDLAIKIKSIHKMLGKRHGVRVIVSIDGSPEKANQVRATIIEKCKDISKVITKNDAAHNLKVTIRPIIVKEEKPDNHTTVPVD